MLVLPGLQQRSCQLYLVLLLLLLKRGGRVGWALVLQVARMALAAGQVAAWEAGRRAEAGAAGRGGRGKSRGTAKVRASYIFAPGGYA